MKLQIDATVIYALTDGKFDLNRKLTYKDLKIKKFDLFSHNALEHTPIIITATNYSSLMNVLSFIKQNGSNLVLEKFDYNYSQNENLSSCKFFITFINYNDS